LKKKREIGTGFNLFASNNRRNFDLIVLEKDQDQKDQDQDVLKALHDYSTMLGATHLKKLKKLKGKVDMIVLILTE